MSVEEVRQITSDNNVKSIVWFALKYQQAQNGKMPETMNDVARYSGGDFEIFYSRLPTFPTPSDSLTNIDAINANTSYCLVHKPNSKVLAYEKPGLWSDGTVAVGLSDLTVKRLSAKEFSALALH